jgi:PncC family amidohydrolase
MTPNSKPDPLKKPDPKEMLAKIIALSAQVTKLGIETSLSVATAESCTGGLIGAAITAMPGSSAVFKGGIIAYANEVKTAQLGVTDEILKTHGAVSEQTALAMASGARKQLGTDIAISVTGIAGPGGGSLDKPVGTVWMGCAVLEPCGDVAVSAELYEFMGLSRNKVRDAACLAALENILGCMRARAS